MDSSATSLMDALQFTQEDLHLNRAGLLSPHQQNNLEEKYKYKAKVMLRIFIFSFIGILFVLFLIHSSGEFELMDPFSRIIAVSVVALPSLILLGIYLAYSSTTRNIVKRKPLIKSCNGEIQQLTAAPMTKEVAMVNKLAGGNSKLFFMKINGKKFWIEEEAYSAFEKGKRYIIYFFSAWGETIVMSVEEM